MPKGQEQTGAAGDQDPRDLGAYGGLGAPGGAASDSDDEPEDFDLSEETLAKIDDPKMRAVAALALRSRREAAEANAKLAAFQAAGGDDDEDEDDDGDEDLSELDARIEALLGEIPEEGYEKMTPALRKILGAVLRDNTSLRIKLERSEAARERNRPKEEFKTFQRQNKGWEAHDETMAKIVRTLNFRPQTVEQFEQLLEVATALDEGRELKTEVETLRKAGPVPSLRAPAGPSVRGILTEARRKQRGNGRQSFADIFAEGYQKANKELTRR